MKIEFLNEVDIYESCKKYNKKEVVFEINKGVPISDFKYLCC
jgi:hypothetical protein